MSKVPKINKTNPTPSGVGPKAPSGAVVDTIFDLPAIEEEAILTGAAADAANLAGDLTKLPRILRVAVLIDRGDNTVHDRLVADIAALCPGLPLTASFAATDDPGVARELATELDRHAVVRDLPELRHVADCLRLLTLPMHSDLAASEEYRRVTMTLFNAAARLPEDIAPQAAADIEAFCVGWAVLPSLYHRVPRYRRPGSPAAAHASYLGNMTATRRIAATEASLWAVIERRPDIEDEAAAAGAGEDTEVAAVPTPSAHKCVVVRLSEKEMANARLRELMPALKHVINTPLPLIETPPIEQVRATLLFEFPYAEKTVDALLADLVGRPTVFLSPTVICGMPGGGKSLFVRRIAQALNVFCARTDASRSDGTVFSGTDRRWNSTEPCHPLLAIARAGHANPIVLLDELEKAQSQSGGRSEFGRLWDCLLGFMENETSKRYPDPAIQNFVDLSFVSYLATANSVSGLPAPLLDRLRVLEFPRPSAHDLDALLPSVIADLARGRGLQPLWIPPLTGEERAAVASAWPGGSVRHLQQLVEIVLRDRDANATKN
jgi:ATPase family protein associated with various cellular activities (AAA)